jgi:protease secretion system membrane fusion protein
MQESRKEVAGQLSEVSKEVESDAARLVSVEADLDRGHKVRATATGQAVGVTVQTVGAVVQAGQKLLDIVPKGEPLLIEAHVATHLIDKVKTGLKADVRFATFSHEPQLVIEGQVASVSKDFLVDQANSPPYYLARIVLTEEGKKNTGQAANATRHACRSGHQNGRTLIADIFAVTSDQKSCRLDEGGMTSCAVQSV